MFENIKYREKRIIIGIIILLLFWVTYKKVYRHTVNNFKTYKTLKSNKLDSISLKQDIAFVKQDLIDIDRILGNEVDQNAIQQRILNFASKVSDSLEVNIVSLAEQHHYKTNDIYIYSNFLELEGSYNELLQAIYTFEKSFSSSKINSIDLYTKRDNKIKKNKLYAKLLFQNFKKTR